MTHFTPYSAFAGGLLIGAAATLLLWLNGRIAGVSGIVSGIWALSRAEALWRGLFVAGLILGASCYGFMNHAAVIGRPGASVALTLAAGFLVGFGTAQAGGCTSGHGVCGLARLSPRALAATLTFLLSGIVTVFIMHHVLGAAT